jgi:hypothetical protein
MRHASDLSRCDAYRTIARRLDQDDMRIGVAENRAEFAHAPVFVPKRELRRERIRFRSNVRKKAKILIGKFGCKRKNAMTSVDHVEDETMTGAYQRARR